MSYRLPAVAAATAVLVLQGCATAPQPQVAGEDLNVGIARTCSFTPATPVLGGSASSTITMTNDGWCAVRVRQADGSPFQLGLLTTRPEHGRVLIQKLGGETRLEYTADPAWTGTDHFAAEVRPTQGADARLQVAVDVSMGEGVRPEAPEPTRSSTPAARSTTRAPARRSTTH